MIKNKFKNSIKRGTGEAILILKDAPELDFSDLIIEASIKNLAYDPQCEGSREDYLYELIQLSPKKEKIEKELLENLSDSKNDYWGTSQLFKLAKLFSLNGNNNARKSIYERYSKNLNPEYEFIDTFVPIDLDSFEGFKFIAEIKGQQLIEDSDAWEYDYILLYAKDIYPEIDFEKNLKIEAKKNKFIMTFLKGIKKSRKQDKPYKRKKHSYKSVLKLIERNETVPIFVGKYLNIEDLIKLAHKLKEENDEQKILKYLKIFSEVKYPLEMQTLFNFLESDNNEIKERAISGLKFFREPEIRDYAINQLNSKKLKEDYLELLIENYNENDYKIITKVLKNTRNKEKFHSLGISVLDVYEKNKTKECFEPLKLIYDKGFCGLCRQNSIEIMIENEVLPEYIKIESMFDSKIGIREIIKNE